MMGVDFTGCVWGRPGSVGESGDRPTYVTWFA